MRKIRIAPSILSADFSDMGKAVSDVERWGADMIHCDVMDGMFVPNITFGPKMVCDIKKWTRLPLDTHLMVVRPERYVDAFLDAGADILTIHAEATDKLAETLESIKKRGKKCGVVINPETDCGVLWEVLPLCDMVLVMSVHPGFGGQKFIPETLVKIEQIRLFLDEKGLKTDLEVDGGITPENASRVIAAGANVLVAGNTVFTSADPSGTIRKLKGEWKE